MDSQDDTSVRVFETRHGLKSVPAIQKGVPLQDYFKNEKLPKSLRRFEVYVTDVGPVLNKRGPVEWSREHDQKVDDMVAQAKSSIEEKGYYWKRTLGQARGLSDDTGRALETVLEDFRDRFKTRYSQEAGDMVKDWRRARNLPVSEEAPAQQSQQQEM